LLSFRRLLRNVSSLVKKRVRLPWGGNKISGLPPLQGGIKGGKSDLCVQGSLF